MSTQRCYSEYSGDCFRIFHHYSTEPVNINCLPDAIPLRLANDIPLDTTDQAVLIFSTQELEHKFNSPEAARKIGYMSITGCDQQAVVDIINQKQAELAAKKQKLQLTFLAPSMGLPEDSIHHLLNVFENKESRETLFSLLEVYGGSRAPQQPIYIEHDRFKKSMLNMLTERQDLFGYPQHMLPPEEIEKINVAVTPLPPYKPN